MAPPAGSLVVTSDQLAALVPLDAKKAAEALLGDFCERAKKLAVIDTGTAQAAGQMILGARDLRDRVANVLDPWIRERYLPWKALTDYRGGLTAQLIQADEALNRTLSSWEKQEEARLARIEAEHRRAEEAAAAAAREKLVQKAEIAEAAGEALIAEEFIEQAAAEPIPATFDTPGAAVDTPGLRSVITYRVRFVEDAKDPDAPLRRLALAIAEGKAPAELIELNQGAADRLAGVRKRAGAWYPGLEVWEDKTRQRTRGGRVTMTTTPLALTGPGTEAGM